MNDEHQYCTFYLCDLYFGLPVLNVQEVIRIQTMTRVPLAPPSVRGLINLRGQIVTALDLRRQLDLPDRLPDELPVNVVIQTDDGVVSLLVDEIGDVLSVSEHDFESSPPTLQGTARELILGAYKLPDRLLLILDTERTINLTNQSRGVGRQTDAHLLPDETESPRRPSGPQVRHDSPNRLRFL